ncbi:MAG: hypothetical protein KF775_00180 [Cyclobacteriaceae bacterium]|nr:hypothetical protein [Cyclobacteriaceae bacterium]
MIKNCFIFLLLGLGFKDKTNPVGLYYLCSHGGFASTEFFFRADSAVLTVYHAEQFKSRVRQEATWKSSTIDVAKVNANFKVYKQLQILGFRALIIKDNYNSIDTVKIRSCVEVNKDIIELKDIGIPNEMAKPYYFKALTECSCDTGLLIEVPNQYGLHDHFQNKKFKTKARQVFIIEPMK